MEAKPLTIPDVVLFSPIVFGDERGFFFESYNEKKYREHLNTESFVQDNHSKSRKGILRGLHYQLHPFAQGKLVRVTQGEVFDVAVDIRRSSPTFGQWVGEFLSSENKKQLWVPPGFAHGFLTLSDTAEFLYKTTNYYNPKYERCIAWNDPELGVKWPREAAPELSAKDLKGAALGEAEVFE